ncbi:MAG TPA: molybdopterin cofactor-binding domain-containing protein, partial [Candidatus Dormibacteraeota bacterium]|nr:molybdopterin cofactor-binding domain-containing protein [Candidatus Dormibacteraeota bacterium]
PYDIRDYEYSTYALATNQSPEGPYRGVGMVSAVLAHERLVDLTAARFGLDPAEVRRINLVRPDQMPYRSVTGHPYESGDYPRALETALAAVDYRRARDEQRAGRRIGIGLASYVEYTGAGSSTFVRRGMADIPGTDTARVWLDAERRVHVQTSCPAIGQGSHTTLAQVAAAGFGVDPDSVVVEQTDTSIVDSGTGTFMSRGSVTAATSVFRAASLLRELDAEKGDPDVSVTYDAVQASHPYATHACLVEVEPATGVVNILRYVVADDCGVLINPTVVEGQVTGGVAQGFGAATMEEVVYASDGQLRSGTFLDYSIPSIGEAPAVEIEHLHTPSTVHELGTKGAGEGGTIGSTAAIANAIADALGLTDVTLTLPLTPDRIARR